MSPREGRPPVIGLLGGVAAGKTAVAELFGRLGATVVSADAIGHAVLEMPPIRDRIVARWGAQILGTGGQIDRRKLARQVFATPQEVPELEAITHPAILRELCEQVATRRRSPATVAIVIDAPLLLEAGLDGLCDVLVFVDSPRPVRLARAAARGWEPDELDRRESHQQLLDVKRRRAQFVLDTAAPVETTFLQVQQLWQKVLGR